MAARGMDERSPAISSRRGANDGCLEALRHLMAERILVMDGATGTMLQAKNLTAEDFGGEALEGCNEILVETRPDVILDIHRAYLAAGADIIETNTFGGTSIVLAEYDLAHRAVALNRRAAELARLAADEASTPGRPRFVAGSIGPTTKAISVTGGITFAELVTTFAGQARGLLEGGVDLLLVETCQDTRNTKAALIGIEEQLAELGLRCPVAVSGTIEPTGTMLAGQGAEAFLVSLEHADLLAVGLNCATGPEFMTDHLRAIHGAAGCAVSCYPNAGLPDENGSYPETPASLASALERFVDAGWLNLVGGCCGTTDRHIRALAEMVDGRRPRHVPWRRRPRTVFTGIELVEVTDDTRPLLVGERTNVIGSRKFRRLVGEKNWDEAAEVARHQVAGGAQIVDVCLQSSDSDELADSEGFYDRLIRTVKVPLMIDSTDSEAVELALTFSQGKAIVNSVNLEDGEERFQQVSPLLRRYGAAVVVGAIDEDPVEAQAFTRERKLEVVLRSHHLLTAKYGLAEQDLIFDPLVFPSASGDEGYIGGAVETLEAVRLIKDALPSCSTILGISNVSFGLPIAAREVVNSVFLYLATKAGLDLAIVNTQRVERYASIPDHERRMAEDLLLNRPPRGGTELPSETEHLIRAAPEDWREQTPEQRAAINRNHIERLADHFRGRKKTAALTSDLPLEERLRRAVIDGTREGLVADLDAKLAEGAAALEIVNGPLMEGMAEVGRLFNNNELIVAEVLQSAESMKVAVAHLEKSMEASESTTRGSILIATVKGDVHDIGKNLVEIILKNNGYDVINLGIKVPPEKLIEAVRQHRPDAVGLSGLLVKSAQQMVATAEDLRAAGIETPILVGGAALSQRFTKSRIAPAYGGPVVYCSDAMAGLAILNRLMDPTTRPEVIAGAAAELPVAPTDGPAPSGRERPSAERVRRDLAPLPAPRGGRQLVRQGPLRDIWRYLNPQMIFGKHLGLRGSFERQLAEGGTKAVELDRMMKAVQDDAEGWMRVAAVWKFFDVEGDGDEIRIQEDGKTEPAHVFTFPRQDRGNGLCLADFVLPAREGLRDSLAMFVVTAGEGVRERAESLKSEGEYLWSHALQALALETAEAAAEWLHGRLREAWSIADPPELTVKDVLAARYRGKRYSFGYPACPDFDDQVALFTLLNPAEIGVELTDGMMMEPEASVSALVFHHPQCSYFSVGRGRG